MAMPPSPMLASTFCGCEIIGPAFGTVKHGLYIESDSFATGSATPKNSPEDLLDGHRVANRVWSLISAAFGQECVKYWLSVSGAEVDFIA
jgi:hypothetical protein